MIIDKKKHEVTQEVIYHEANQPLSEESLPSDNGHSVTIEEVEETQSSRYISLQEGCLNPCMKLMVMRTVQGFLRL